MARGNKICICMFCRGGWGQDSCTCTLHKITETGGDAVFEMKAGVLVEVLDEVGGTLRFGGGVARHSGSGQGFI